MTPKAKLFVSLFASLMVSLTAYGQLIDLRPETYLKEIQSKYPFIQTSKNQLEIFGSGNWDLFFSKFNTMRGGHPDQLHIIHIGGSHVQAGILSHQIEKGLKGEFPSEWLGDKGFIFPFQLSKTNPQDGYKIQFSGEWHGCRSPVKTSECAWGVSGINAYLQSPSSKIFLAPLDPFKRQQTFNLVKIFCDLSASNLIPEPYSELCPEWEWIDSTSGVIYWYFPNEMDHLEFLIRPREEVTPDSPRFVLQGLKFTSDKPGVVMHPIGVNGASLQSYLRCQAFESQLAHLKADIVLFAIGVNDANVPLADFNVEKFEQGYDDIIGQFKRTHPETAIVFITNNDTYYNRKIPNKNGIKVKEVMYRLAEKHEAAVWNLFDIMGGLGSIYKWQLNQLAKKDKIHFTTAGYQLIGDLFTQALVAAANQYQAQTTTLQKND